MGVGKSTIAERIASFLFCKHTDLDKLIEQRSSMKIEDIFSTLGEDAFRKMEEDALEHFISTNNDRYHILSLGGGALVSAKNRNLVREKTFCIYLKANKETLRGRIVKSYKNRPLMQNLSEAQMLEKIDRMLTSREPGYIEASNAVVDVDNLTVGEVTGKVVDLL